MSFTGSLMIEKRFLDKDSLEKYIVDFFAEYKGHRTLIARTKDPDVFEIYDNDHQLAVELGFDRCDKYCYNLMVNKTEIKFITKKVPCELPWRKK